MSGEIVCPLRIRGLGWSCQVNACTQLREFAVSHHPLCFTATDRLRAMECTFLWDLQLFSVLFTSHFNPLASARASARRLVESGEWCTSNFQSQPVNIPVEPLLTQADPHRVSLEQLSYFGIQRLSSPSRATRAFWPSDSFARKHGSWTGSDRLPNVCQIAHGLLCTATWLRLVELYPTEALNSWTSERALQHRARRDGTRRMPIPDGLIELDGKPTAIEVVGQYSAAQLKRHVERFETQGWEWELW